MGEVMKSSYVKQTRCHIVGIVVVFHMRSNSMKHVQIRIVIAIRMGKSQVLLVKYHGIIAFHASNYFKMHFHLGRDFHELSTIYIQKKERSCYQVQVKCTSLQRRFFRRRFQIIIQPQPMMLHLHKSYASNFRGKN